ncbi:hypothetical protein HA402_005780 [Bradysia odoriphaga]|nr:hypothetical protein HA402_005780 [Bradysia odoriphaga]
MFQAFKLKSHLSRHEKSVHGQIPTRKKISRLQPNETGELVTVPEPQSYHRHPNEKPNNFQPFSNDSLFYVQDKDFPANAINSTVCGSSNNNMLTAELNDVHQFQIHQNSANLSDYVMDNLDIFHNCDAQHQAQNDFSFHEQAADQQCYTGNELDHNNWSNFMGTDGNFNDKTSKMPLIELNSNEYIQIPPMMQYQNPWHSDSTQMDISAAQSSQKITYNNIGNILTNLELLGNNSNFDASNFEIITSNRDQQSKVILNDVNPSTSHHNGMSYFNIPSVQQSNFIDLQANNLQSHTITDISNTYVTETQRHHLHQTRFFQNRDILNEDVNKNCTGSSNDAVDTSGHQTAIVFPSLTDYLPNSSTHGFN